MPRVTMKPIGTKCWIVLPDKKEAAEFVVVKHLFASYMVKNLHGNIAMQVTNVHETKEQAEKWERGI